MDFKEYAESAKSKFLFDGGGKRIAVGIAAVAIVVVVAAVLMLSQAGTPSFALEKADDISSASSSSATSQESEVDGSEEASPLESDLSSDRKPATPICVYVTGCVNTPGVFYLDPISRISDAVVAAGGMTSDAAVASVNLAEAATDGLHVHIPSKDEASLSQGSISGFAGTGGSAASLGSASSSRNTSADSAASGKVNINTASAEELQTVSGIGPSKAKKIIEYREKNGPFKKVEDLSNVSGIGDKTVQALRDSICV